MTERFTLKAPLAGNTNVDLDDAMKTKIALRRFGYYSTPGYGMTPYPDAQLFKAVADLQRDKGLRRAGEVRRGDDTEKAIRVALSETTPNASENSDKKGKYIWRTRGDSKVRSAHAERDGKVFEWNNPPEGGHPGEAPNCRCRAEGVTDDAQICRKLANAIENTQLQIRDDMHFVTEARQILVDAKKEYVEKENEFYLQLISLGLKDLFNSDISFPDRLRRALKALGRLELFDKIMAAYNAMLWAESALEKSQKGLKFLERKLADSQTKLMNLRKQYEAKCGEKI